VHPFYLHFPRWHKKILSSCDITIKKIQGGVEKGKEISGFWINSPLKVKCYFSRTIITLDITIFYEVLLKI